MRIGFAAALRRQLDIFLHAFVCIETANKAFAIGIAVGAVERGGHRAACQRFAVEIEHNNTKTQLFAARNPTLAANAYAERGWHEANAAAGGEQFAVGIGVFQFCDE